MMGLIDFWFSRMTFGSRGTYGAKPRIVSMRDGVIVSDRPNERPRGAPPLPREGGVR